MKTDNGTADLMYQMTNTSEKLKTLLDEITSPEDLNISLSEELKSVQEATKVTSGFFVDLDEMTVKVAIALPLGVNLNSGSLARFPAIAIAVMLCASHSLLVWRLCLVFFLFLFVHFQLFHPKFLRLCNVVHRSDNLQSPHNFYKFSCLVLSLV